MFINMKAQFFILRGFLILSKSKYLRQTDNQTKNQKKEVVIMNKALLVIE